MLAARLQRRRWLHSTTEANIGDGGGYRAATLALKALVATAMAWAQTTINKDAAAG